MVTYAGTWDFRQFFIHNSIPGLRDDRFGGVRLGLLFAGGVVKVS